MLPCGYLTSVLGVISHSPDSLMVTSSVVGPSILASVIPCGWRSDSSWSTTQPGRVLPQLNPKGASRETHHQSHAAVDQGRQDIEAGCVLPHVERWPARQGQA